MFKLHVPNKLPPFPGLLLLSLVTRYDSETLQQVGRYLERGNACWELNFFFDFVILLEFFELDTIKVQALYFGTLPSPFVPSQSPPLYLKLFLCQSRLLKADFVSLRSTVRIINRKLNQMIKVLV